MSALMGKRLSCALLALGIVLVAGLTLSVAEDWLARNDSVQPPLPVTAQTMAGAVLEGAVEEMVASCGGALLAISPESSSAASDDMPPWLAEIAAGLELPDQVLVGQGGELVSLCWHQGGGQSAKLAELLETVGWQRVESGLGGCCTYIREKGEGEWLMITEWNSTDGVTVVARYV